MAWLYQPLAWDPTQCADLLERVPKAQLFVATGERARSPLDWMLAAIYVGVAGRLPSYEETSANVRAVGIEEDLLGALDYGLTRKEPVVDAEREELTFFFGEWTVRFAAQEESDVYLRLLDVRHEDYGTFASEQGWARDLDLPEECRDALENWYEDFCAYARRVPFMIERYRQYWSDDSDE